MFFRDMCSPAFICLVLLVGEFPSMDPFFYTNFSSPNIKICSKVLNLTLVPILHIKGIEKVILEMAPKNQNGLFLNPKNSCLTENCFCKNDPLSSGPVTFSSLVHFLPIFSATDATREGLHLLFWTPQTMGALLQKWRETLP